MVFDIKSFEEYRENNRFEAKAAKNGLPRSLWETYSSFANCNGGVILLGAMENEDGSLTVSGLDDTAKLLKEFWDTINNKNKVSVNLLMDKDVEETTVESGCRLLIINVPAAKRDQKPVYINNDMFNGSYRRNWEGDYHCSRSEVLAMLRDAPEETSDMRVLENMSLEDLDTETIHAYRNRHMNFRNDHVWEKLDDAAYLERIGAAAVSASDRKLHPTAAGLLMFAPEYKILYEFPEYFLDYREVLDPSIRWTDRLQSGSGDWTGNLFDFFFRVYGKLVKDLKVPFKMDGIVRVDDTEVHRAVREALANCIVNADFRLPRGIVILKDDTGIRIENPGSIRTGKKQMLKGGVSDPRNKAIMKMLNLIGIGERAGSGVPGILSVWEKTGYIAPSVEESYDPDRTSLTLPLIKTCDGKVSYAEIESHARSDLGRIRDSGDNPAIMTGDKKTSGDNPAIMTGDKKTTDQRLIEIFEYIEEGREYSAGEIAAAFQLKSSRVRELLTELVKQGKLEAVGANRNRRYIKNKG